MNFCHEFHGKLKSEIILAKFKRNLTLHYKKVRFLNNSFVQSKPQPKI